MKSRWNDSDAKRTIQQWGSAHSQSLALRLYAARLIGTDPSLVLCGGGNVSLKDTHQTLLGNEVETIHVKASGFDLTRLEPPGLPAMDLSQLLRLRDLDSLTDDAMVNELRRSLFDASAPTPSIETLVHAFLPHRFIDHSHADAILALTNHANGEQLAREAMGDSVAVLPYVRPGFELANAVADLYQEDRDVEGIVLAHHGLITFADDARTAYEKHIALVDACERFLDGKRKTPSRPAKARATKSNTQRDDLEKRATVIAPILRGLLAHPTGNEDHPFHRSVLEWRTDLATLQHLQTESETDLAGTGPLTGDHLIHTKPWPLLVDKLPWGDKPGLRTKLQKAVDAYRHGYRDYIEKHGGSTENLDTAPRVILIPDAGLFAWGPDKRAARITADIAQHTLDVKSQAKVLGPYEPLPQEHLWDMEFRDIQRVKLGSDERRSLESQIVVISGAAGAIGAAVADSCAAAGAHVALTDVDDDRLAPVVQRLEETHGQGTAIGLTMDVTSESSVCDGYAKIVQTFGGIDVIVPNAGIAHVAPIDQLGVADFRRVMEVNAVGYLLFMQEGIKILKAQALGGHIVINASKNVFGPGKDFGAYSASKAAGHQLGKVAAIELAPHNIRVNMINADAVFGDEETPSGLWATVGPQRAKSRNLKEADLPEYYRARNLLKARVYGRHVGNAVVFFASNATPTTGATLPIDGGVVEAFPR